MFSISFRKHRDEKKKNNLLTLIIKMQILFARTIITSTARDYEVREHIPHTWASSQHNLFQSNFSSARLF